MSKKILSVLAPVAALIAFMVVPTLAQATTLQANGIEVPKGATVKAQSIHNSVYTPLQFNAVNVTLQCQENVIGAEITSSPQTADITGTIKSATFKDQGAANECSTDGTGTSGAIITTENVVGGTLQVQQPDATTGETVAHLTGKEGNAVKFRAEVQSILGNQQCGYETTSVQLIGKAAEKGGNDLLTTSAAFTKFEGGSLCNATGTLSGSFQIEDAGGHAGSLDMT
ncbi:MAG TPA: hypothetical protein VII45_02660 [Solirubrobacterales bacterium]